MFERAAERSLPFLFGPGFRVTSPGSVQHCIVNVTQLTHHTDLHPQPQPLAPLDLGCKKPWALRGHMCHPMVQGGGAGGCLLLLPCLGHRGLGQSTFRKMSGEGMWPHSLFKSPYPLAAEFSFPFIFCFPEDSVFQ